MYKLILIFSLLYILSNFVYSGWFSSNTGPEEGGVDISFPQHHYLDKNTWGGKRYNDFMEGCYKKYAKNQCDATEIARINQNFNQPKGEHNYTELGFKKMKVPEHVWGVIKEFWDLNKNNERNEQWPPGNTYTNHWVQPTGMVSLEDRRLRGGDGSVKRNIWDGLRPILEEWVGQRLVDTSLYGIRVYHEGAMLASHVDRLPLVTSCIIHVDSVLREPWPIEVFSHDGTGYNVTMAPGDMVLYESHTVIHGRPTPLQGDYYANVFVHFAPIDHDKINEEDRERVRQGLPLSRANPSKLHSATFNKDVNGNDRTEEFNKGYKDHNDATNTRNIGGHEQNNHENLQVKQILKDHGHELKHPEADLHSILHKSRGKYIDNEDNNEDEEKMVGPQPPHRSDRATTGNSNSRERDNTSLTDVEREQSHLLSEAKKMKDLIKEEKELKKEEEKLLRMKAQADNDNSNSDSDNNDKNGVNDGNKNKKKHFENFRDSIAARLEELKNKEDEIKEREKKERDLIDQERRRLDEARSIEMARAEAEEAELQEKQAQAEQQLQQQQQQGGGNQPSSITASGISSSNNNSNSNDDEEEGRLYKFLPLNEAAARGDVRTMKALLKEYPYTARRKDVNGWTALHEAARAGHQDAVKLLIDFGARIGAQTNRGESPLWWAKRSLPDGHTLIPYLIQLGAPETGGL